MYKTDDNNLTGGDSLLKGAEEVYLVEEKYVIRYLNNHFYKSYPGLIN